MIDDGIFCLSNKFLVWSVNLPLCLLILNCSRLSADLNLRSVSVTALSLPPSSSSPCPKEHKAHYHDHRHRLTVNFVHKELSSSPPPLRMVWSYNLACDSSLYLDKNKFHSTLTRARTFGGCDCIFYSRRCTALLLPPTPRGRCWRLAKRAQSRVGLGPKRPPLVRTNDQIQ